MEPRRGGVKEAGDFRRGRGGDTLFGGTGGEPAAHCSGGVSKIGGSSGSRWKRKVMQAELGQNAARAGECCWAGEKNKKL
jgi:hypothetical protein